MEARLLQREDEIERLKTQLEQGIVAESDTDKSPEQRRKAEDARLRACQDSVEAHIQEIGQFLKTNGLEHVNPTGETLLKIAQEYSLTEVRAEICKLCQACGEPVLT